MTKQICNICSKEFSKDDYDDYVDHSFQFEDVRVPFNLNNIDDDFHVCLDCHREASTLILNLWAGVKK